MSTYTNTSTRKASVAQQKFIADLCTRRGIPTINIETYTYDQAYMKIEELKNAPTPATPAQRTKINTMITQMQNAGQVIKHMTDEALDKLTGGTDGTAFKLISHLMDLVRDMDVDLGEKPTDDMVHYIASMYYYPEATFEEYGIPLRIQQEETYLDKKDGKTKHYWKEHLPLEFEALIRSKMTKKQASEFIGKHRVGFNQFKQEHISANQVRRIKDLEKQLASIRAPHHPAFQVDIFGNISEIPVYAHREYDPEAYKNMDDMVLMNLTTETANKWIQRLEIDRSIHFKSAINNVDATFETIRQAKNITEAGFMELKKIDTFLYAVEAITGVTDPTMHVLPYHDEHDSTDDTGMTNEFFNHIEKDTGYVHALNSTSEVKHEEIKDYLRYVFNAGYTTFWKLYGMTEDIPTARGWMEEIKEELEANLRKAYSNKK